jgi:hypothetical protein
VGHEVTHDWLRLNHKVAQHFIGPPVSQESNSICVDVSAEQGHRASSAQGPSTHVQGLETKGHAKGSHGVPQGDGNIVRGDVAGLVVQNIGAEGSCYWCVVLAEVLDTVDNRFDGADERIAAQA